MTRIGQPIGAIVADTKIHAQRAAKVVKIEYENIEPVIVSIEVKIDCLLESYYKLPIVFIPLTCTR